MIKQFSHCWLLLIIVLFINIKMQGQCPGNITFTSQAQIDQFPTMYPTCTNLSGNVLIQQNPATPITNINGLAQIERITGTLTLHNCSINSLAPLSNVDSIGGSLLINGQGNLQNLTGLQNIRYIGNYFEIWNNQNLTDISALSNLEKIEVNMAIGFNNSLSNLNGFESLGNIGQILLLSNPILSDVSALENVSGLYVLNIQNNPALSQCSIESFCNYLSIPSSNSTIANNAVGCNTKLQILAGCNLPCPTSITFSRQVDIDEFPIIYPTCYEINGDLTVQQNAPTPITNLNGLSQITKVGGRLKINNSNITSLAPLSNLDTILGPFESGGLLTTNLNGLQNLKYIGSHYQIWNYANLTDISALSNLTHIGGAGLIIGYNPMLTNINGIQNLGTVNEFLLENNNTISDISAFENVSVINYVRIINNPQLSICNIESICNFLSNNPTTSAVIGNNNTGCNSAQNVLTACELYCLSKGLDPTFDHIGEVVLGTHHNSSGMSSYTDFTIVTLGINKVIPTLFSITPNKIFPNDLEYYKVWIDFNSDYSFSDSELVFSQTTTGIPSGLIDLPDSIPNGTTRMRVSMRYNNPQNACQVFDYGEVEDYTVYIYDIVEGCTLPNAHNYNVEANADDGSCETCDDGILNGDEVGIDCGGTLCETCPPPIAVCGDIVTVTVTNADRVYNGPGASDVYLVESVALDWGSSSNGDMTREVKRLHTNVAFNWTTNGACVDATPNSVYNNNDKGLVLRNCLPVTPADFNKIRNFEMKITDGFGTSTCSGRYKIILSSGGSTPINIDYDKNDLSEIYTDNNLNFEIYPNPGYDRLNLKITDEVKDLSLYSIVIYNSVGQVVKSFDEIGTNLISVNTESYSNGLYQIVLISQKSTTSLKWMKIE